MSIQEIQEKKILLEIEMSKLIDKFYNEVDNEDILIGLNVERTTAYVGDGREVVMDSKVKVNLSL